MNEQAEAILEEAKEKSNSSSWPYSIIRYLHAELSGEELLRLAEALDSLPEAQREALTLHHLRNWTLEDVGRHLGRSPAAVAGLIKRGLKQLRLLLRERE